MKNKKQEDRRKYYDEIFKSVDETERKLVDRLIDEVVYYEDEMDRLRELPWVAVNPRNPAIQKTTAAAKVYKGIAGQYMNAIRILLNVLRKVETSEQDELLKRLEEFT